MERIRLGGTGLKVSPLAFGTMTLGDPVAEDTSLELLDFVVDQGINFIDTANGYNAGLSEEIIGRWMKARGNRERIVLATKVRYAVGDDPDTAGSTPKVILREVENSLRRLNTDYIDIYYLHQPDDDTPIETTWRALESLVSSGKVRYIGCSNLTAWQLMKALAVSRQQGLAEFISTQSYYSIAGRELEREMIPLVDDQGLGLLPWSPLAGGFLSGKFTRESETDPDARRTTFDFPPVDKTRAYDIIDVMRDVATAHEVSVAQIALAWLLHQPAVTSVIIGAKRLDQLDDNLGSVDLTLTDPELERLNTVSALAPEYPGWMQILQADRAPGTTRNWDKYVK